MKKRNTGYVSNASLSGVEDRRTRGLRLRSDWHFYWILIENIFYEQALVGYDKEMNTLSLLNAFQSARIMKKLLPILLILVLLGCNRDRDIEPEDITEMVYSYTFGFTGATSTITIDPTKEIFEYYGRPEKCEKPINPAEWSSLVEGFDWNKFRKIKSQNEPICCDIGGVYLKVTAGSRSHEVNWQLYRPDTTSNVGNLMNLASGRLQHLIKVCP